MSFLLYRRPDYVAKLPGPMSQSQCQLYVDRTQKHKRSIPPELSFDNIVQNKALPPCSLQDFMDYLIYISHDAENLQFFIWLQDYTTRFYALPQSEQALSPPWTFDNVSSLATDDSPSPPATASSASPSKKVGGTRASEFYNITEDVELGSILRERFGDDRSFLSETTGVATPDRANNVDVNAKAGLKWQSFTIQPYRSEIAHVITHYFSHSSPRELNISHHSRTAVLHALQHTSHPSAFSPLLEVVEATLRRQSHPNFIRWSICNGNRPRVLFVQYAGLILIVLALVLAVCLILSQGSRWWRVFTFPLWFLGIDIFVAAYKGLCIIIHTNHNRSLRPWEQFPSVASDGLNSPGDNHISTATDTIVPRPLSASSKGPQLTSPIDPSSISNEGQNTWVYNHEQQSVLNKIFAKTVWVQNETVRVLQDRIVWQSHVWAVIVAGPLTAMIVALPIGGVTN